MHLNLRTKLILAAIPLTCNAPALGTTQTSELALIDGGVYSIPMDNIHPIVAPLEALWDSPITKLGLAEVSTACHRRYVGIWEIHDGVLYLRALEAWLDRRKEKKVSMKTAFPDRLHNGRVKADWFSGKLAFLLGRGGYTNTPCRLRFTKGILEDDSALRDISIARDDLSPTLTRQRWKDPSDRQKSRPQPVDRFLYDGMVYYLPAEYSERAFPVEKLWTDAQRRPQFSTLGGGYGPWNLTRGYRAIWEVHENNLYMLAIHSWVNGSRAHLKTLFPDRFNDGRVKADWFSGELSLVTNELAPLLAVIRRMDPPLDSPKVTLRFQHGRLVSATEHDRVLDWSSRRGIAGSYVNDEGIEGNRDVVAFTDFESDDWRKDWSGGQRATVSVVSEDAERDFEPLLGRALRIKVTRGGHYGASLQYRFKDRTGSEPEYIYFRYYLRLGSDWDPARGGKLPGIGGTYGRAGWGGRPSNGRNGWSARGQFNGRKDGKTPIGFYCYHADMKGRYGSSWVWEKDGLGHLENNRWYCIEQRVRLNTPGENDGFLAGWVDGKLAFRKTDVRMRDVPDLKIECIWINVYHGGTWSADSDDHLYIDNVVIAKRNIGPIEPPTENN